MLGETLTESLLRHVDDCGYVIVQKQPTVAMLEDGMVHGLDKNEVRDVYLATTAAVSPEPPK